MSGTTGLTRDAGWQVGVRRTVPAQPDAVWTLLRSREGTEAWLGGPLEIAVGPYRLADGTDGEIRVDEPGSHLRLTWRPPGREAPTVVQVRVLPAASGSTIAFHQEWLDGPEEREAMRARWTAAIGRRRGMLDA